MASTDSPGVIAPPPLLYGLGLLLGYSIQVMAPATLVSSNAFRWAVGLPLLLFSTALAGWAFAAMHAAGTNINPYKPSVALVTAGPFRFSRNPIYVAVTGIYFSAVLWMNSVWPLLLLLPVLMVMHWGVILREERYLSGKFGEAYKKYRAEVRRWL